MTALERQKQALIDWLLSSDYVPARLGERVLLDPVVVHERRAWRFEGQWTLTYAGEVGRQRTSHSVVHREELGADGTVELAIAGTESKSRMEYVAAEGEISEPFDVCVVDGELPGPSSAWAGSAVRDVPFEAADGAEAWSQLGREQVELLAQLALRSALDSPHLDRLDQSTTAELTRGMGARVRFLEVVGTLDGEPLKAVIGPDGSVWGRAPSDPARKEEVSSAAAGVVLASVGWGLAVLVGLFAMVIPGLIAAAVAVVHIRSLVAKRDAVVDSWKVAQRPDAEALPAGALAGV